MLGRVVHNGLRIESMENSSFDSLLLGKILSTYTWGSGVAGARYSGSMSIVYGVLRTCVVIFSAPHGFLSGLVWSETIVISDKNTVLYVCADRSATYGVLRTLILKSYLHMHCKRGLDHSEAFSIQLEWILSRRFYRIHLRSTQQ